MAFSNANSPLPKYQYEPLPDPKSIRLLEIISYSAESGEFEGKLHVTDLGRDDRLRYKALSYTWKLPDIAADHVGRPAAPAIVFDGCRLAIGCNLFDFLEQAFVLPNDMPDEPDVPEGPQKIWIDAVCINQDDLTERSAQVAFMREIYDFATGVVVWLGRHDSHSRQAMALVASFAKVDKNTIQNHKFLQIRSLTDLEFYEHNHMKPLSLADWGDLRSFFSRSWFHRLWTVQELVINDIAIVLCGETVLAWDEMDIFLETVNARGWTVTFHLNQLAETGSTGSIFGSDALISIGAIYRSKFTPSPKDDSIGNMLLHFFDYNDYDSFTCAKLAWILQLARNREVTDQRDKIFGSQGLASKHHKPEDWHLLKPDYTQTVGDVFTQGTRYILQKLRNLSFLSYIEDKSFRACPDLPSWVPDFSTLLRPSPFSWLQRSYNSSCGIEGSSPPTCPSSSFALMFIFLTVLLSNRGHDSFTFSDDGIILNVCGVRVDVLDVLSGSFEDVIDQRKLSTLLIVAAEAAMIYHNGETRGEVLMKTLIARSDGNTSFSPDADWSLGFEDLQLPFSNFLKMNLAFEIWRWNSTHSLGRASWWDERKDFEHFCDQEPLLPSRSELEDYFEVFLAFLPAQDLNDKPIIDDPDFTENIFNPQLPYLKLLLLACLARCLWVSEEKYVGLAPRSARQGDQVWIIHGSKTPAVLRKRPDGSYEFLGEAYVHGLMNGEFFKRRKDSVIENITLK